MPELAALAGAPHRANAARRGVTDADILAVLGMGGASAYALYWAKTVDAPAVPATDRARLDAELLHYVANRWSADMPNAAINAGSLWRSGDRPWQLAAPDYDVHADSEGWSPDVPVAALAVGTWDDADAGDWDGSIPPEVRARLLWQMDALGVSRGHAGFLFLPSGEFRSSVLWHDEYAHDNDKTCTVCDDQELLRTIGLVFFRRVQGEMPAPPADGSDSSLAALKARWAPRRGSVHEVDPAEFGRFAVARAAARDADAAAKKLEAQLREAAGDATVLTIAGKPVARRVVRRVTGASWLQDSYRLADGYRPPEGDDDAGR